MSELFSPFWEMFLIPEYLFCTMTFISDLTIIAPPEALAVSAEIMILFF